MFGSLGTKQPFLRTKRIKPISTINNDEILMVEKQNYLTLKTCEKN